MIFLGDYLVLVGSDGNRFTDGDLVSFQENAQSGIRFRHKLQ